MKDFISKLQWAHDVTCPICSKKASFKLLGGERFETICCECSNEMAELIDQRIKQVFEIPNAKPSGYNFRK